MAFLAGARVLYRAGLRRRRAHRLYRRGGGVREARPGVGCAGPTTTRRAGGDGWGGGGGPGDEKLKEETIWAHPLSQAVVGVQYQKTCVRPSVRRRAEARSRTKDYLICFTCRRLKQFHAPIRVIHSSVPVLASEE